MTTRPEYRLATGTMLPMKGKYLTPGNSHATSRTPSSTVLQSIPIVLHHDVVIDRLATFISTGSAGGGHTIGLYHWRKWGEASGDVIVETGELITGFGTGFFEQVISNTPLAAGVYLLAMSGNGIGTVRHPEIRMTGNFLLPHTTIASAATYGRFEIPHVYDGFFPSLTDTWSPILSKAPNMSMRVVA